MITIYNRQKQQVGSLQTSGNNTEVYEVTKHQRLNSDYDLTFLIPMNSSKYKLLEDEGLIECEGQKYIIKGRKRNRQGMGRTVQITCQHIMRRMMDIRIPYDSAVEESFGKDISYLTNIISQATGNLFTFQIMDSFLLKDIYKWGYSNCLKAFQDLVNLYGAEFVPDNYTIKLYKKITIDNGLQYRYAKNIINDSFETNTNALVTRLTGLAKDSLSIINLPASNLTTDEYNRLIAIPGAIVGGLIKVPYIISQYASTWGTTEIPYYDGELQVTDVIADTDAGRLDLLNAMRKKLAEVEVPEMQIQVDAADLWRINSRETRPQLGETVYATDVEMEMNNFKLRVMEITEYPFDPSKNTKVTLANYILKDYQDIVADLNTAKNEFQGIMTNKKINAERFVDFARQAVHDIDNSKTEVKYDIRGIILQDKLNALNQVVMSSNGIYLTVDGGLTSEFAMTAQGIVADLIRVGTLKGIRIEGVTIVGPNIKTSDTAYPRAELSSINNLIAAYSDANNYIALIPNYNASPSLVMVESGTTKAFIRRVAGSGLQIGTINSTEPVNIQTAGAFQMNGINGWSGTISYVKNVVSGSPTFGSITVSNGIVTNVT